MNCLLYPRFPAAWRMFGLLVLPTITLAGTLSPETNLIPETAPAIGRDATSTGDIEAMAGRIAESMGQHTMSSLGSLAGRFRQEQSRWLWITPPLAGFTLNQDCGMVVFDAKAFPDDFNKKLVGEMKYDCPVYGLTISEDPLTRETVFFNADGVEIARLEPEEGYNPFWLLDMQYPELRSGLYDAGEIKGLQAAYDPSRVRITLQLLPSVYVDQYAMAVAEEKSVATAANALKASVGGITPMMMYQGPALTNLLLSAIENMTNGIKVTLAYPNAFTNRVDFFTCSDLIGGWWDLAVTTNVSTSQNWIEWTDTNALSLAVLFYAAGNADMDSDWDGISDAREKLMYHTNSYTNDTDYDGLTDSNEVFVTHTDPNNSKTNKPNVWISYPANESRKVWLP